MRNPFVIRQIRSSLIVLLLIVIIPVLILEAITYYKRFESRKSEELQANLELARAVSGTFQTFVENVFRMQLNMGLVATASPSPSKDSLRKILKRVQETYPMLRSFAWMSPEGVNLVTTNPATEGRKNTHPEQFSRIAPGEDRVISPIYNSPDAGDRVFTIFRVIRDSGGKVLGVVSCVCMADKLSKLLSVQREKDAGISLIDNKGVHVWRYPLTEYRPEQRNWLQFYPMIKDALNGKEVLTTVTSEFTGKKRLVAFVPVSSFGWVVAASREEHEVVKEIASTLLLQAGLLIVVTLAGFAAAIAFSRPISKSIIRLRDHALALGRGEMSKPVLVSGPPEVKDLAVTLNQMAEEVRLREKRLQEEITERKRVEEELRRSHAELEMRVQERTEELSEINEALRLENDERLKVEIDLRESENRLRELSTALLSAQERERKLIAGEIHDSLGASLAIIKFKVEDALKEIDYSNPQTRVAFESVIPIIQGTMDEARRIQMSLRPSMLDDLGILATINWLCRQVESTYSNISIKREIDLQEHEVPEPLKIVIYRILQEALNNIAKHSRALMVLLSLRKTEKEIQLVIRDNGQGFDLKEAYSRKGTTKGLGLDSMRERAELSGGFFSIESRKGTGTVIQATWLVDS